MGMTKHDNITPSAPGFLDYGLFVQRNIVIMTMGQKRYALSQSSLSSLEKKSLFPATISTGQSANASI